MFKTKYFYLIVTFLVLGFCQKSLAQNIVVTGKVFDGSNAKKEPIPGVSVSIIVNGKINYLGSTNAEGDFRVTVDPNAELSFSYIGMRTESIKVGGRKSFSITLQPDAKNLKEVEIKTQGYISKTRTLSTGSSITISGKELQGAPTGDVMSLLQGKVAGLNIQNNTGAPGFRGTVAIRGLSNINTTGSGNNAFLTPTAPLFVIDGVPVDDNATYSYGFQQAGPGVSPASQIPAEDIEEIQVLKDAAATALYGSRGAYGVILITTKRGSSKVPVVNYSGTAFLSTVPQLRTVIGGKEERLTRINQILANDTSSLHAINSINGLNFLSDSLNAYYNNSTNWQSYFYRPTYNQNHNLSISGGDVTFNYKVALGAYDESGVQKNTGYSRYNVNTTMTYFPSRKFKLIGQLNNSVQQQKLGSGTGLTNTGVATGGSASSLLPSPSLYSASNEVLGALETKNSNKTLNTFAVLQLDYEIIPNLKVGTVVNYTNITGTKDTYTPAAINGSSSTVPAVKSNDFGNYYSYNDRSTKLYNRTSLNYNYSINDKGGEAAHNFNVFVFTEVNSSNFKADVINNAVVANDYLLGPNTTVPAPVGLFDEDDNFYFKYLSLGGTLDNFSDFRSVAFAGQFSYNYKQRYVIDFNYRTDGSSFNGPLAGYKKNPSIALKWNIDREAFADKFKKWLDYASIRGSYGTNIAPNGTIYDVYGKYIGGVAYQYNNNSGIVIKNDKLPNLSLEPTKNTTLNGGVDLSFLNGKFGLNVDAYYKQVTQIFRSKDIANINSFGKVSSVETANVNYGWEFQVNSRPLNPSSPFKLNIYGNLSINKEVLAALPNGVRLLLDDDNIYRRLGINSLSNYLYHNKGVYATNADVPVDPATGLPYRTGGSGINNYFKAGDPIFTDLNGDYILNSYDKVVAGNSQPKITGGLGALISYKNFSLEVNTSFTLVRDILNNALAEQFRNFNNPYKLSNMVPLSQYNYWRSVGQAGAIYANPFDYTRSSDKIVDPFRYDQTLFQEDGTYFKFNSIKFYYNWNQSFTRKIGMNRVSTYLTVQNLGFLTNYSGPNPEAVSALGRDGSGGYPISRQFALGLNVQF